MTKSEVKRAVLASLGLNPEVSELGSQEAVAALIRRTASLICPCPPRLLVKEVSRALEGLVPVQVEELDSLLESIVAHGDLLELWDRNSDIGTQAARLIYIAPPAYVGRRSGSAFLIGIAPDGATTLPPSLEGQVEMVGHVRRLPKLVAEDRSLLQELGVRELTHDQWLRAPARRTAGEHLAVLGAHLEKAPSSGEVPGLRLLDPSQPIHFYQGRWREPGNLSGRLVGRRPQAYGADLWCFVEISAGEPKRFIDFPVEEDSFRGCDEAWRLQAAIDAVRGDPQQYRLRSDGTKTVLDLFSPLPAWARRRWETVGSPLTLRRSLFSYELPSAELEEEIRFLNEDLWLAQSPREK